MFNDEATLIQRLVEGDREEMMRHNEYLDATSTDHPDDPAGRN